MKGSKGYRRRSRNLKVKPRDRGKLKISAYLQSFEDHDKVSININPSFQKIPHPRFNGRTGKVVGSQGRAYLVELKDGGKRKSILVPPEHLRRVK
jgi:large subunit ribosomal protein L21e